MSTSALTPHPVVPPAPDPQPKPDSGQAAAAEVQAAVVTPAHFVSPVINVDPQTGIAVLMVRDGSTGRELSQTPTKAALQQYVKAQLETVGAAPSASDASSGNTGGDKQAK